MPGLNLKQQRFVQAYLESGNATQSYIKAGYKKRGEAAESGAAEIIRNRKVQAALKRANAGATERAELTAELVLAEMRKLAFLDPRKAFNTDGTVKAIHELDADTAACLSGFEVEEEIETTTEGIAKKVEVRTRVKKVKFWDKRAALVDLGKHFELWGEGEKRGGDEPDRGVRTIELAVRLATLLAARQPGWGDTVPRVLGEPAPAVGAEQPAAT